MKKVVNFLLEMLFYFVVFTILVYIASLFNWTTFSFDKTISFTVGYAIGRLLFSLIEKKFK